MVIRQEAPTLFIQQEAVHNHQRVFPPGSGAVDVADHLLLAGALLAADDQRLGTAVDLLKLILHAPGQVGQAVKAGPILFLRLLPIQIADTPSGIRGRCPAFGEIEGGVESAAVALIMATDVVDHVVDLL